MCESVLPPRAGGPAAVNRPTRFLGSCGPASALPLAAGKPVLRSTATSVHLGDADLHLVSSTAFDLGVLIVVVGVAIGMISRLDEEAER